MPLIERDLCCGADLNDGPVPNKRHGNIPVRQWTAHDEVIVAMHHNTDHDELTPPGEDRESDNRSQNGTPLVPSRAAA
jgi:hypothetical protein